jgi:hypothetical protein
VAHTAPRVGVGQLDELLDGGLAVTDHVRRHALGHRGQPAVDDQAPVVAAGDVGLDDHPAATGLVLGDREGLAHVVRVLQVEAHAPAVVAIQRLDHDGVADPLGHGDRLVRRTH